MVMLEFSMSPMDKGESLSKYVSEIIDYIDKSGVTYKLTPMGTILEGEWDDVMDVVSGCYGVMSESCDRISLNLKADIRKGTGSRLESKIQAVEGRLKREVKK